MKLLTDKFFRDNPYKELSSQWKSPIVLKTIAHGPWIPTTRWMLLLKSTLYFFRSQTISGQKGDDHEKSDHCKHRALLVFLTAVYAETGTGTQENGAQQELGTLSKKIKAGDTLKISVWKYSDMDASLVVGGDGSINYSYVGEIPVAGRTAEEVRLYIVKKLDQDYIANPQVDVRIDTKALTIFVVGEVLKPGSYLYEPGLDPLKAIALAGGLTDFASTKAIIVRKAEAGDETEIKINIKKLMKANPERGQYELEPGDMVVVKRGWL